MDSASESKLKQVSSGVKGKSRARAGTSSKVHQVPIAKLSDKSLPSDLTSADDDIDFEENKSESQRGMFRFVSDDEALSGKQATSVYEAKPINGMFNDAELLDAFMDDFVASSNDKRPDLAAILRSASDIRSLKIKLNKIPLRRVHFTQFSYKTPIRLAVITNMYGAFVNTTEAFSEREKIFDMTYLQPKHKVSMLLPSVDCWWQENSKLLMREFVESKLVNDLKRVIPTKPFAEIMNKFGLEMYQCRFNLRDKILSATRDPNEGKIPGVFNVKIPNSQTTPSRIHVELMEFRDPTKNQCDTVKWKRLILEPKYIHAFAVISISGFMISRTGLSLDSEVEFLNYANIPSELQRSNVDSRSVMPKKFAFNSKWIGGGDPDSNDDEVGASAANTSCDKSNLDKYLVC